MHYTLNAVPSDPETSFTKKFGTLMSLSQFVGKWVHSEDWNHKEFDLSGGLLISLSTDSWDEPWKQELDGMVIAQADVNGCIYLSRGDRSRFQGRVYHSNDRGHTTVSDLLDFLRVKQDCRAFDTSLPQSFFDQMLDLDMRPSSVIWQYGSQGVTPRPLTVEGALMLLRYNLEHDTKYPVFDYDVVELIDIG